MELQAKMNLLEKTWLPPELMTITFFGYNDKWEYYAVSDNRLCDECRTYAELRFFRGDMIRGLFQELEVMATDEIQVNVHPHCRCYLLRVQ